MSFYGLQAVLERQGIKPLHLARQTGVNQGLLSRILRGQRPLTEETARRLAPVLGGGVDPLTLSLATSLPYYRRRAQEGELELEAVLGLLEKVKHNAVDNINPGIHDPLALLVVGHSYLTLAEHLKEQLEARKRRAESRLRDLQTELAKAPAMPPITTTPEES